MARDPRSIQDAAAGTRRPRLGQPRHNLPAPLSSFVGRAAELAELERLHGTTRLLTLTGAGGIGKTRLALRLAERLLPAYRHGAWQVELAALAEPRLLPAAVAAALGVHEQAGRPLVDTLAAWLARRELLLVLDNCEHLLAACAGLTGRLLRGCPGLRILATSRQSLGVAGETRWPVPPLALPAEAAGAAARLADSEAVRLFVERATAARPDFALTTRAAAAVAEICRRLDGIPLAIELAAARVTVLTVEQLAARLDDRFRLLAGADPTALPRHQTLRAAMAWSHELLSDPEQILFRRLAVFAGGWTLEAAEAVCAFGAGEGASGTGEGDCAPSLSSTPHLPSPDTVLDLLAGLVDKSLVVAEERVGEVRYRLLETLRQYEQEKLRQASEEAALRGRHRDWFLRFAELACPKVWGPEQATWLERLEAEHDNLRAALAWSRSAGDGDAGLRLGWAMMRFWDLRGYHGEGRAHLAGALASTPGSSAARARALSAAGFLAMVQGDLAEARALLEEGLALARASGDPFTIALSLEFLAAVLTNQGELGRAAALLEESLPLSCVVADEWSRFVLDVVSLFWRANIARMQQDSGRAGGLLEAGLARARERGDPSVRCYFLSSLGHLALQRADYERAAALLRECLVLWSEVADPHGIALSVMGLACVASAQGLAERAARLLGAADGLRDRAGFTLLPQFRDDPERALAAVRLRLDEAAFASAWAEGRAMPLEQAVRDALGEAEPEAAPAGAAADPELACLSPREREVAALVAGGLTNRQIAAALIISEATAASHVAHILTKLGFRARAQIATWATERSLAPPPPPD